MSTKPMNAFSRKPEDNKAIRISDSSFHGRYLLLHCRLMNNPVGRFFYRIFKG